MFYTSTPPWPVLFPLIRVCIQCTSLGFVTNYLLPISFGKSCSLKGPLLISYSLFFLTTNPACTTECQFNFAGHLKGKETFVC